MQSTNGPRILIVGASVAGLACALVLSRAGHQVTLVDEGDALAARQVGAIVHNDFRRAVQALGLTEALSGLVCLHQGLRFCGVHGEVLAALPAQSEVLGRMPAIGLVEGDFVRVLHDAAVQAGARLMWATEVVSVRDEAHGVSAQLADGEVIEAGLLVLAQGVRSPLRSALFGDQYRPRASGVRLWRSLVPRPPGEAWAHVYARCGKGRAACLPVGPDRLMVQWAHLGMGAQSGLPATVDAMCHELASLGGVMGDALKAMRQPGVPLWVTSQETFAMPPPWHKGHVLLVGDAAHGSMPQWGYGLSQALEDALVLGELWPAGGATPAQDALSAFARRRHPRTKLVADVAHNLSQWETQAAGQFDFVREITRVAEALDQPM